MKTLSASYIVSGLLIQHVTNFSCITGQNSSLKWRECRDVWIKGKKKVSLHHAFFKDSKELRVFEKEKKKAA